VNDGSHNGGALVRVSREIIESEKVSNYKHLIQVVTVLASLPALVLLTFNELFWFFFYKLETFLHSYR